MKQKEAITEKRHKRVFICSPLRPQGNTVAKRAMELRHNRRTAQLACEFAVRWGYLPLAPHLYFPQFLSDSDADERERGIRFGLEWLKNCDEFWIIGRRITEGMEREIRAAAELKIPTIQIEFRNEPVRGVQGRTCGGGMDPGYEEDDYYHHDVDEDEEGLLYDGD